MTREGDQHLGFEAITASAVMDGVEPSPIPGMDLQTFRNYLTQALSGDSDVPVAVLSFITAAQRGSAKTPEGRERQRWQDFFWHHAMQDSARRIQELIEAKQAERGLLLADIQDGERLLALFERHKHGQERAETYRRIHGDFELNDVGDLADADAEDMLKSWEKRTGKKLDRRNPGDVQNAFRDQAQHEDAETLKLQRELNAKRTRVEELGTEIQELEDAKTKATAALESGADPRTVNEDLQRELIAKGHGTDAQKRRLAEEQGIGLPVEQLTNANDDEFDGPSAKSAFNQARQSVQPERPPPMADNALRDGESVKQPALNPNG